MYILLLLLLWYFGDCLLDNLGIALGNHLYFADFSCVWLDDQPYTFDIVVRHHSTIHFLLHYLITAKKKTYDIKVTPLPSNTSLSFVNRFGTELLLYAPEGAHVRCSSSGQLLLTTKIRRARAFVTEVSTIKQWPLHSKPVNSDSGGADSTSSS